MSSRRTTGSAPTAATKQGATEQRETKQGLGDRLREKLRAARARWPVLDHVVRALDRNAEALGFQEAAAVTYFGFLAFFPLLALGFALVGYFSVVYPEIRDAVTEQVQEAFPTLIGPGKGQISISDAIEARGKVGLFGLVGLLVAGLGWINSLRNALRRIFGTTDVEIAFLKRKLLDIGVVALLGISLLMSVMVTSTATAATEFALDFVGLEKTVVATVVLKVLSVTLALLVDTVLFTILLSRLPGARLPWRRVRGGAFLGACGFEVLKLVGTFFVGRTTANPLYAAFGVAVGLLVWMNLVARLTVFAAAWTVTQPFSLEPAGLGDAGTGRNVGPVASTEPVSVVVPPDFEPVPVAARWRQRHRLRRNRGWRTFVLGAVTGALVSAKWRRRD